MPPHLTHFVSRGSVRSAMNDDKTTIGGHELGISPELDGVTIQGLKVLPIPGLDCRAD